MTALPTIPFYQSMVCGAHQAAFELGGDIKIDIQGSKTIDAAAELLVFDSVVITKPSGILLVPYDSQAFIEPTRTQMAAGMPIVTADGSLNEPVDIQNWRTDNAAGGGLLAEEMAKVIPDDGVVAIITASPSDQVQMQRVDSFVKRLQELKPKVTLLPTEYAEADAAKANQIASAILLAHPNLSAVFTSQGNQAEGAGAAIKAAGKAGVIPLYSYDTWEANVANLRAGIVTGILAQSPYTQGYEGTKTLVGVIRGTLDKSSIKYQNYSPLMYVDKSNIDAPATVPFMQDKDITCPN